MRTQNNMAYLSVTSFGNGLRKIFQLIPNTMVTMGIIVFPALYKYLWKLLLKMEWPSKNVPRGGFLQPAKCKYTPETHEFIKLLTQESKMTLTQNKKNNYFLRTGEPFPTKSKSYQQLPEVTIRPGTSKKRSKDTIVSSGIYEREKYLPRPCLFDREKEKEKLQNKMAFNGDIVVRKSKIIEKKVSKDTKEEFNRFDQLVQEIKEREEWLEEMDRLGQGEKYRQIIELQIQEKVREMNRMKCAG